jgi:hypothetical protein
LAVPPCGAAEELAGRSAFSLVFAPKTFMLPGATSRFSHGLLSGASYIFQTGKKME